MCLSTEINFETAVNKLVQNMTGEKDFQKFSGLIHSGHYKMTGKENSFIFLQSNLPWLEHVLYTIVNCKNSYRGRPIPLNPWRS